MVTLSSQTEKVMSRHDIYIKVNFGLWKTNRKKFSSSVIDSCIYKRKYTMKKDKQVPIRQDFETRAWVATANRATCADILSFLRVINFFKKSKETVRMKEDGSEMSLINVKKKKRRSKEKVIAYNTGYFLRVIDSSCNPAG